MHLWHDEQRELVTSFGRFGRSSFAHGFRYGNGIVGNAFRFCRPASYRSNAGRKSLIFEPPRPGALNPDWIVAVPLLVDTEGPAAGVLSFAGSASATRGWQKMLLAYAVLASGAGTETSARLHKLENQLIAAITIPFWKTVAALPPAELAPLHAAVAEEVRNAWTRVIDASREKAG